MEFRDDDLERFERDGAVPLPRPREHGYVDHEGARLWYASYGEGPVVFLLHGGLGHSGNWGYQVPALISAGYQVVVMDTRGHGRSTKDERPYSYELLASDLFAVLDALGLEKARMVGWSDGACTALVAAFLRPERVCGVFFFACNVDSSGVKPFEVTPVLNRCFQRHKKDYEELSPTPERFLDLPEALAPMQRTQPNYSAEDLAGIRVPVTVVLGEHDEFIKLEHAEYLARSIPSAELVILGGVSHFAPLQRPGQFNEAVLRFLGR